jgi:hypothetical protein
MLKFLRPEQYEDPAIQVYEMRMAEVKARRNSQLRAEVKEANASALPHGPLR